MTPEDLYRRAGELVDALRETTEALREVTKAFRVLTTAEPRRESSGDPRIDLARDVLRAFTDGKKRRG